MKLSEIATVSGKGGLFKVVAPTKSGVILESLDDSKTKMVATTSHKLSLLNEISIYTTTKEGTVPLAEVLRKIHKEYASDLGVDANADNTELKSFLKSVLPEYDESRVYTSDIKKLVKWYDLLLKFAPDVITKEDEVAEAKADDTQTTEADKEKEAKSAKEKAPKKESAPKAEKKEKTKKKD